MRYRVWHKTTYRYGGPVSLSHNQIRVHPRAMNCQHVLSTEVSVDPIPVARRMWADSYGNTAEFFSIEHPHELMSVTATSVVERSLPWNPMFTDDWRDIAARTRRAQTSLDRFASQFQFSSKYAYRTDDVIDYAGVSLSRYANLVDAVTDLMHRIYEDFEYKAASTTIDTKLEELFEKRRGVCQDFSHFMIACLRSWGVPSRYVSGYILTHPPPGQTKMVGSDASHAWVSVYAGNGDWIDFDPTNDKLVQDEHITLAWGRDFSDVSPVQGVLVGGGTTKLSVSVDVAPID